MKAFIQRPKGSVISCRVFDPSAGKWWTGSAWSVVEAEAELTLLDLRVLADPALDNYYGDVAVPAGPWFVVEYIDAAGNVVRSEPAVGSIAGVIPEGALLVKVQALTKDTDGKLSEADWANGIAGALGRYSKHRPKISVADIAGDGTHLYAVPAGWGNEFSAIESIEYPIGNNPETLLDKQDDYAVYVGLAAEQIRLVTQAPPAPASFRVKFTVLRTEATIAANDLDAVANLAASICLGMLAARYIGTGDSTMQADAVNYRSKSQEAASRAKACLTFYNDHMGVKDDTGVPGASAISSTAPGYPGGGDRLTHRSWDRKNRWR